MWHFPVHIEAFHTSPHIYEGKSTSLSKLNECLNNFLHWFELQDWSWLVLAASHFAAWEKPGSRLLAKMLRPPNLPPSHPTLPKTSALTNSRIKTFEAGVEQLFLQNTIYVFFLQVQSSEAGAAGCSVLLHRTAAASSSRQKGAEQQQRKAQQQPGCFALLCLAAHCTAPTTARHTHLPGKCCKICKFLRWRNGRRAWELNVND